MRWSDAITPTQAHAGFWEGLAVAEVRAGYCDDCGRWMFYPRVICPHCGSRAVHLRPLAGEGVVYSVTTVRRPLFEDWGNEPYRVVLADMREGVRVMGRLLAPLEAPCRIGDPLRLTVVDVAEGKRWFLFKLLEENS